MPQLTEEYILDDGSTRRNAYCMIRMKSEMVMASVVGDDARKQNASKSYATSKKEFFSRLAERARGSDEVVDQTLSIPHALLYWAVWLFSATTQLWGAMLVGFVVVVGFTAGVYLQYTCLFHWEKSAFGLTAKITAASGDIIEAISLIILDVISTHRTAVALIGLTTAAGARIAGKVFSNSLRWSMGGVLCEIFGELALCCLRWRLMLTESRWNIPHSWRVLPQSHPITVAEQAQVIYLLWTIEYKPEFVRSENLSLTEQQV